MDVRYMEQTGWPTDPEHPIIKRLVDDVVNANGGWQRGSPDNTFDAMSAFVAAVDWKQPPLLALAALHIALLAAVIALRRHYLLQFVIIALCWAAVLCGERLNVYCRGHSGWLGMSADYFDNNGVFVSAVWSAPLALVAFVALLCLLYDASSLLIIVKRKEVKVQRRQRQQRSEGQQADAEGTAHSATSNNIDGAQSTSEAPATARRGGRKQVSGAT